MNEQEWKEYRDAIYYSNIQNGLAGKMMVAIDNYFTILNSFDPESFEGSKIYLISQGVNVDSCVEKGLKVISELKQKTKRYAP